MSAPASRSVRALCAAQDRLWATRLHRVSSYRPVILLLVACSRLGDGCLWYTIMLALPFLLGPEGLACALQMGTAAALCLAIYKWLKALTRRARPYIHCPDIQACAKTLDQWSFPSGHTLHAVSFTVVLVRHFPEAGYVFWPYTVLVALSRVVLGLHYPSDVLAGAVIGVGVAAAVLTVF